MIPGGEPGMYVLHMSANSSHVFTSVHFPSPSHDIHTTQDNVALNLELVLTKDRGAKQP